MVKQNKNRQAFTLIETIFILFILVCLIQFSFNHQNHIYLLTQTMKTLKLKTEEVQYQCMQNGIPRTIRFETSRAIFPNETYVYPDQIYCDPMQIGFNAFGNIRKAATLVCHHKQNIKKVVFQLGSGKSEIR